MPHPLWNSGSGNPGSPVPSGPLTMARLFALQISSPEPPFEDYNRSIAKRYLPFPALAHVSNRRCLLPPEPKKWQNNQHAPTVKLVAERLRCNGFMLFLFNSQTSCDSQGTWISKENSSLCVLCVCLCPCPCLCVSVSVSASVSVSVCV